ncbi:MAG: hypothetical protein V3V16_12980 [Melioribacteraceae bacterium]
MKTKLIYFIIISFLILSCKTTDSNYKQNLREVKYFQSIIHNIDRKIITLADGNRWKTNRFVISVNMTEVFFIVNFVGFGDAYINGAKYSVSHVNDGSDYRYFNGYSNMIKSIQAGNNIIELSDDSKWLIVDPRGVDIEQWRSTSEVVKSEDENIMINPYKIQAIEVKRIRDELQTNN